MLWGAVPTLVQGFKDGVCYGTLAYAIAKTAGENLHDRIYRYLV